MRPETAIVPGELQDKDLLTINASYKKKIDAMDSAIKKRLYLTPFLDIIPRLLPKGLRLEELSYKNDEEKTELDLKGTAYLGDKDKEAEQVKAFVSALKDSQVFSKSFQDIQAASITHKQIEKINMTDFSIVCKYNRKGK
jgi:hypothetical protein